MILKDIENRNLHDEVMKWLISLIPKECDTRDLSNLRHITLFPVIYKIFTKTLQVRLQPMLRGVISSE